MKKIQEFGGFFDETTIVLCGDALIDLDIKSALFEHKRKGAMASVVTKEVPWDKVSSYGVVVTENDGRIKSFQENPARPRRCPTLPAPASISLNRKCWT
jgi:mannose-1-phosphate guanylyltransferase